MKILSLFDGISIAQQAFKELGFEVEYYASEIDKQAISITQKNHPNTEQLGDVKEIDTSNGYLHYGKGKLAETDIYFLIGGSPCQDLSIAKKNREGLNGKRSGLFWEYVRILKELKPRYFILENVASMPKEAKQTITDTLYGIEPIMINASLVSAQNRKRLFWIGRLVGGKYEQVKIEQPEDRRIYLKDILEKDVDEKYLANLSDRYPKKNINKGIAYNPYSDTFLMEKARALNTGCGSVTTKNATAIIVKGNDKHQIRRLTPIECERLQSIPDRYTEIGINEGKEKIINDTQRYKALGNGFNCAVIKHIIKSILVNKLKDKKV